jgi:hypothetical protein
VWESAVINFIVVALQLVCYDPHLHITSLDRHANILTLLNIPSAVANSDSEVRCSRGVHGVALYGSAKPHFQIRCCQCLYELEKFSKTRMFKVRY